jgi:hypothetical protein
MIKGVTESGFKYEVDPKVLKSYSFLKLYANAQKDQTAALQLISYVLGEKQEERLIKHATKIAGFDDVDVIVKEFGEIVEGMTATDDSVKN